MKFLPDGNNFDDLSLKTKPVVRNKNYVLCPLCKGYGFWNLRLNAYGPGKHFQAGCSQCMMIGWVEMGSLDEKCIHKYSQELTPLECEQKGIPHYGRCWHVEQCELCGKTRSYDSSG